MEGALPESRLVDVWRSAVQQRQDLQTAADGPVRIIYPGRPNDGRGADIRDAVIATGQGLRCGDIELHIKASAWREHRHDLDPAYNQVVLHVVREDDTGGRTRLQNGAEIPTLALERFTEVQPGRRLTSAFTPDFPMPCSTDPARLAAALETAGEARFFQKSAEFAEALLKNAPEQVLYRGLMTALGYSKNKTPMARLADLLPLAELTEALNGDRSEDACLAVIQARLLGAAGLLPSQFPVKLPAEINVLRLEKAWQSCGGVAGMSFREWEFYKVRPGNYPTRRLAAMAVLLVRFRKRGILQELEDIVLDSVPDRGQSLEKALLAGAGGGALLGADRAGEMIVNIILPFYAAYAAALANYTLGEAAFRIYHDYRPGPANSIEKHMRQQLGLSGRSVGEALPRQGLIHLYKAFCTQGRCAECELGSRG